MTEPARAASQRPRSSRPWRLYLVAGLAGTYLIAWRAAGGLAARSAPNESIAPSGPGAVSEPTVAAPLRATTAQVRATAPRTVWLDELPAASRPSIAIPPGWQLATRRELAPTPRPVLAPAHRALRVRTRSS